MLTENECELLLTAVTQVMEESAFVFVEPAIGPLEWNGPLYLARIPFSGANTGEVVLVLPHELAEAVASEMMGEDNPAEGAIPAADVSGEIANMIAGVLEHHWPGKEPTERWNLDVPEVTLFDAPDAAALSELDDVSIRMNTEDEEPIQVGILLHAKV